MVNRKLIAPDGGYGWIIAGAYSLYQLIAAPTVQIYALLFKDAFKDLDFTATDTTFILNTHAAITMFMGITNRPLLKYLGCRKASLFGAAFFTVGITLTAFATTVTHHVITFSLVTAIGIGISTSTYRVSFNRYFVQKRSKAVSYVLTISGFGIVLMPQLISYLLKSFGAKYAIILMSALTSHTFISAMLLQPVEWHMKKDLIEDYVTSDLLGETTASNDLTNRKRNKSILSLQNELEIESNHSTAQPLGNVPSLHSLPQRSQHHRTTLHSVQEIQKFKIYIIGDLEHEQIKMSYLKRIWQTLVNTFDLTLLNDPVYINILLGLSLALFGEMNFSILTPFIMSDYGLSTEQIAALLSVMAAADVVSRLVTPYVTDYCRKPVRVMYLWCIIILIFIRFGLLMASDYYVVLGCCVLLGFNKGFRTVYWSLIIPNYVPIDRLAAALGIQSTLNGILVLLGAPLFGLMRNMTGSYKDCIYVINAISCVIPIMWMTEFFCSHYKRKADIVEMDTAL